MCTYFSCLPTIWILSWLKQKKEIKSPAVIHRPEHTQDTADHLNLNAFKATLDALPGSGEDLAGLSSLAWEVTFALLADSSLILSLTGCGSGSVYYKFNF